MDRGLLIYNPFSGDQSVTQKLDYIVGRFQDKGKLLQPYRIMTDVEKDISNILSNTEFKFIVAAGGDGTLNSVSNIILKHDIGIPMGIIPAGTCNDFASILDIPSDLEESLDIILGGNIASVDVGLVNGQTYFLSSCAGGIFAGVSFNTNNEFKKSFGAFAYYLKALGEVANLKPFRVHIKTDKDEFWENILMFFILNGKQAGGFANIVKEADYTDGLMDMVLIRDCRHIDLAGIFFSVISNDGINNKNVTTIKTKTCTIEGSEDIILSIDGEKGPCLPIDVKFINKALRVFTKAI
ncbi:MAG: YegS/Rv2252/BmrU family lipid kinase [Clostridium sp.]|nr:YegS/Rv2252/BmrU family lipid kinase [Clostridium sp.]